nr:MAG TPA: hypothetical protein [Caudoviricetes sp.]
MASPGAGLTHDRERLGDREWFFFVMFLFLARLSL